MPTIPPIDPSFTVGGPEWGIGGIQPVEGTQPAPQEGFGGMLSNAVAELDTTQQHAAGAAQTLADGTATDPTAVVMQVERAQLAMQLASQIRTKAVEAYQTIFSTQV
jgi:flagellar hook-basal body complex protein FliE